MGSQPTLTIAIVGGGIGGLAFAVALSKSRTRFNVDIYESATSFSEIGAGIGIWPRVWDTLVSLGLEEDLKSSSTSLSQDGKVAYYKADQAEAVYCGHAKEPMQTFHRAEFLKILQNNIPAEYSTCFSKRLVSYEDNAPDPVVLHFKDGTTAECDILVGADGIKSAVRRTLFTKLSSSTQNDDEATAYRRCIDATWSGLVVYRGLIPADAFKAEHPEHPALHSPVFYMGKHAAVMAYPISQGQIINAGAMTAHPSLRGTVYEGSWFSDATNEEMSSHFPHWDSRAHAVLEAMKQPSKWAINEVRGLPTFVSGRVALLGDAAHAMTPHLASGAGQAVEDALLLATLLSQPEVTKCTIGHALAAYDEVRRPLAQNVQELSFKMGQIVWLDNPRVRDYSVEDSKAGHIPESVLTEMIDKDWVELHKWTWETDVREDLELAVEKLKVKLQA